MKDISTVPPCNRDPGDEAPEVTFAPGENHEVPPGDDVDWVMASIALELEIKRLHKIIMRSIPSPDDSDAVAEILAINAE